MQIIRGSHFFVRKLHSLLGVIPLGIFLSYHLLINSLAFLGAGVYNKLIEVTRSFPYLPLVELAVIFVPLVIHGFYGLVVIREARLNLESYPFARNWYFWLQRVTGLVIFAFLAFHIGTLRLSELLGAPSASFDRVASYLNNPWVLAFYISGIVSTAFHLANGLWLFGVNWGLLVGPRAQRMATRIIMLVFIALSVIGVNDLRAFIGR